MKNWKDIFDQYAQGYEKLSSSVVDISENDLDISPEVDCWTIRQIVHHLADGSIIWAMFIRQALGDQGGEVILQWYWGIKQDDWADKWGYAQRDIQPSLNLFKSSQDTLLSLLNTVDTPQDYSLQINSDNGETSNYSILDIIQMQIDHLDGHLDDINTILKQASR